MGQICDCLYRWHQHHNRIEQLESKIIEYEQFMEQWLVNNSCCVARLLHITKIHTNK